MPPHLKVILDECLHGNMHGELKGAEVKSINLTIMLIIDLTQFYLCIGGFSMVKEVLDRNGGRRIPIDTHIKLNSVSNKNYFFYLGLVILTCCICPADIGCWHQVACW